MTNKKKRINMAKLINHKLPFVIRHTIAKRICRDYDNFNFAHTPIRVLREIGINFTKVDEIINICGKEFITFQWKDYGDSFEEPTINLTNQ